MNRVITLVMFLVLCSSFNSFSKKKDKIKSSSIMACLQKNDYCKNPLDQNHAVKNLLPCLPMHKENATKDDMLDFLKICSIQTEQPFKRLKVPADPCSVHKIGNKQCCEALSGTFESLCSATYETWKEKSIEATQ